ncbi:MAG: hypothetical protein ACE5JE_05330 [Thermoplasmata archaeon]
MSGEKRYTEKESHRKFAVDLFNHTWDLLDKENRTEEEDDRMVHAAHASRLHWGEVGEPQNLAVGEWQIARVYSALHRAEPALHHARHSLEIVEANGLTGFYRASALEGVAKAYSVAGDADKSRDYIQQARGESEKITDREERDLLFSQLAEIPEYSE